MKKQIAELTGALRAQISKNRDFFYKNLNLAAKLPLAEPLAGLPQKCVVDNDHLLWEIGNCATISSMSNIYAVESLTKIENYISSKTLEYDQSGSNDKKKDPFFVYTGIHLLYVARGNAYFNTDKILAFEDYQRAAEINLGNGIAFEKIANMFEEGYLKYKLFEREQHSFDVAKLAAENHIASKLAFRLGIFKISEEISDTKAELEKKGDYIYKTDIIDNLRLKLESMESLYAGQKISIEGMRQLGKISKKNQIEQKIGEPLRLGLPSDYKETESLDYIKNGYENVHYIITRHYKGVNSKFVSFIASQKPLEVNLSVSDSEIRNRTIAELTDDKPSLVSSEHFAKY